MFSNKWILLVIMLAMTMGFSYLTRTIAAKRMFKKKEEEERNSSTTTQHRKIKRLSAVSK